MTDDPQRIALNAIIAKRQEIEMAAVLFPKRLQPLFLSIKQLVADGQEKLKGLEEKRDDILQRIAGIEALAERFDAIDEATEQLTSTTEQIKTHQERLGESVEQLRETVDTAAEVTCESISDFVDERLDGLEDFSDEIADLVKERFDGFVIRLEEQRNHAQEQLCRTLSEMLPDRVTKQTEKLTDVLKKLDDSGLNEIGRISESVGNIAEKIRSVELLVQKVKPVLDMARQML